MSALAEALKDLKAGIEAHGFDNDMVEEVAEEYGLKAALLTRKFEEQYGRPACEWKKASVAALSEEFLLETARKYWMEALLIGNPEDSEIFGKEVEIDGKKYLAVAYVAGNRLMVVEKASGRKEAFVWKRQIGIQNFLAQNLI